MICSRQPFFLVRSSFRNPGVHVLTGPIFVEGAEPGDVLKVEILDLVPRVNPDGKTFGSNAAAWWGYHARANKVSRSVR
jgi:acetamidase/formamidase